MRIFWQAAVTAAVALIGAMPCRAQEVAVGHPVYTFLERCESQRLLARPLSLSFPYSRSKIASLLHEIREHEEQLTGTEQRQFRWYLTQFQDADSIASISRLPVYRNRRDLYSMHGDGWGLFVNPVILAREGNTHSDRDSLDGELSVWGSGGMFYGRVQSFTFSAEATDQHVRGNTRLADHTDFPYHYGLQTQGFDFDEATASIGWESRRVELVFGKTRNRWGPGWNDALTLSDRPTSYTQLRSRIRLGPLELISVQAKLQQYPPVITAADTTSDGILRTQLADKYFAAHRLEWSAGRTLLIGLNESIMYGERGFDLDYVHPLIFLRSAEHYTGDRDNALLGGDFKWQAYRGLLIYGELLVDDVTTTRLGTGWFGNKFAWQTGLRWYDPLWLRNTRFVGEYARVEPYVYSHKFSINNYQQYGTLLGASIGPNADAVNASLAWTVIRPLEIEGWGRVVRHGANPPSGRNVGGDFNRTWAPGDSKTVKFLDGDRTTVLSNGLRFRYEVFYNLFVSGAVQMEWSKFRNENGQEADTRSAATSIGFDWNRR
jgi:hypothetical protein